MIREKAELGNCYDYVLLGQDHGKKVAMERDRSREANRRAAFNAIMSGNNYMKTISNTYTGMLNLPSFRQIPDMRRQHRREILQQMRDDKFTQRFTNSKRTSDLDKVTFT